MMWCHGNQLCDSTNGHMAEYKIKHPDVSTGGCMQRAASLLAVSARMLHGNNITQQKPLCPLTIIMINTTIKLREAWSHLLNLVKKRPMANIWS